MTKKDIYNKCEEAFIELEELVEQFENSGVIDHDLEYCIIIRLCDIAYHFATRKQKKSFTKNFGKKG